MNMNRSISGLILALLVPAAAHCQDARLKLSLLEEKEETRRTLSFTGSEQKRIVVDNTDGAIAVTGYDGDLVQLVVRKEIRAESPQKIAEAKEAVMLEIKEEPNKIILYVDAPWRTPNGIHHRGFHYYGYAVTHDVELRVPKNSSLYLRTVNDGTITVNNVEGELDVKNVNSGIELTNIAGLARVATVNGPIKVSFRKNPESACSFRTINGKVEVEFQRDLSADMNLKTFNGEAYTDFEIVDIPHQPAPVEQRKGRRKVYRKGDSFSVRVGKGGPELSFDTLNGDIYILKQN